MLDGHSTNTRDIVCRHKSDSSYMFRLRQAAETCSCYWICCNESRVSTDPSRRIIRCEVFAVVTFIRNKMYVSVCSLVKVKVRHGYHVP